VKLEELAGAHTPTPWGDGKCPEAHERIGVASVWSLPVCARVRSVELLNVGGEGDGTTPWFRVSVADKGVRFCVSLLE